jgi:hypothetical protein
MGQAEAMLDLARTLERELAAEREISETLRRSESILHADNARLRDALAETVNQLATLQST